MAGGDFGGNTTLKTSIGVDFALREMPEFMDTGVEVEAIRNLDGSTDRVFNLVEREVAIVFRDDGQDIEAIQCGPRFNATIVEEKTKITHICNDCFLKGKRSTARANGQVTGLSLVIGGKYIRKQR